MVSLRSALSILFVLVVLSVLFFIPSKRTGFVTEVKSSERILLGYVFAFLALLILSINLTKREEKEEISKDTKEVVKTIAKEAEKAEKAAEKIMFVSKVKQLGMAIGGALLFFGLILFAVFGLIVMNRFPILVPIEYKFLVCAILILLGSLHILGGIALIA